MWWRYVIFRNSFIPTPFLELHNRDMVIHTLLTGAGQTHDDLPAAFLIKLFYRPCMAVRCSMVGSVESPMKKKSPGFFFFPPSNLSQSSPSGSPTNITPTGSSNTSSPSQSLLSGSPTSTKRELVLASEEDVLKLTEWDPAKREQIMNVLVKSFQTQIEQLLLPSLSNSAPQTKSSSSLFSSSKVTESGSEFESTGGSKRSVDGKNVAVHGTTAGGIAASAPAGASRSSSALLSSRSQSPDISGKSVEELLEEQPHYSSRKRHCVSILLLVLHMYLQSKAYLPALKVHTQIYSLPQK